jgi:hypothetical protein
VLVIEDDHGVMRGKQNICVLAAVSFYQQRQQFWRSPPSSCCGVLLQAVAAVAFLAFSSDQEHGVLGSLFQLPGAAAAVYSEQHVFFSRAEPPAAAATTSHPIDATSCLSGVVRATVAVGASMTYWASHRASKALHL